MKGIIKYIFILALVIWSLSICMNVSGQQDSYYSQYTLNPFLINPATAGYDGYAKVNLMAREQWVGIAGTPKTHAVSFQIRLIKNNYIFKGTHLRKKQKLGTRSGRVGLGGYIYNDHVGLIDRTGFQLTYAYHIPFKASQLSFGLSLNAYQFKINYDKIEVPTDKNIDPLILASKQGIFIPDANFGVYYTSEKYYIGFSASDLAQSSLKIASGNTVNYKLIRQYNLMGAYRFPLKFLGRKPLAKLGITLEPNFLLKVSEFGAVQNDVGCRVLFGQDYWAGLSYRTPNAMIIMGGLKIDKFYIGYAFDANFSSVMRSTYGSHEISIAYKFGENVRRFRWLTKY